MVRVGVIGCGRIAERHVDAYRRLGARVTVADQIPELANGLAERFGVEVAARPQDLLDAGRIEAIDVCVPTLSHAAFVEAGLDAGKHVFCEKPLCSSMAEAKKIEEAQRRSGKLVMVGYLYRFHPAYQYAKEIVTGGVIGRPHLAIFRLGGRGNTRAWKHEAGSGGGATLEMLVHVLDIAQWLLGPLEDPQLLTGKVLLPERRIADKNVRATAEDYVVARFTAGAAEVLCEADLVTPSYQNFAEVHGSNGSLLTSIQSHIPTVLYCSQARGIHDIGNSIRNFPTVNLFELELKSFLETIASGKMVTDSVEGSKRLISLIQDLRPHGGIVGSGAVVV